MEAGCLEESKVLRKGESNVVFKKVKIGQLRTTFVVSWWGKFVIEALCKGSMGISVPEGTVLLVLLLIKVC